MSFTRHGHHIAGTVLGNNRPATIYRCGGPRICGKCKADSAKAMDFPTTYEIEFDENGNIVAAGKKRYKMQDNDRVTKARRLVYEYVNLDNKINENHPEFTFDDVTIVWFNKTLQHWKAMVITTLPDSTYYEVTYNGDKEEFYLDVYEKTANFRLVAETPYFGVRR